MKYILLFSLSFLFSQTPKEKINEIPALYKIADRISYMNYFYDNNLSQYYVILQDIITDSFTFYIRNNTPDTFKKVVMKYLHEDFMLIGGIGGNWNGFLPLSDTTYIIDPYSKLKTYGIVELNKHVFIFSKQNIKPIKETCYQLLSIYDIDYGAKNVIESITFMQCNGMEYSTLKFNKIKK